MNDREKWQERESGISVLATRHDDYDDDDDKMTHNEMTYKRIMYNELVYDKMTYKKGV